MPRKRGPSRKDMVVLTVALPPEVHRALAHLAIDENASINQLIREAVRDLLERKRKGRRRRQ